MSRAKKVREILRLRMHPLTVREICVELNLPSAEAKFVSSVLAGEANRGTVTKLAGQMCSVTHQKATAYMWADPATAHAAGRGAQGPSRPQPAPQRPPRAPRGRSTKAAPPPPPPRFTPDQQRRADARRKAAEAASAARQKHHQAQLSADRKTRAFLTFERITGCRMRDRVAMKTAYRQAAMKHHPDRGGDPAICAELTAAWQEIGE